MLPNNTQSFSLIRSPNVLNIRGLKTKYKTVPFKVGPQTQSYISNLDRATQLVVQKLILKTILVDFGSDFSSYPLYSYYNIPSKQYVVNIKAFKKPLYDIPFRDIIASILLASCTSPDVASKIKLLDGPAASLLRSLIVNIFGKRYGVLSHPDTIHIIHEICIKYIDDTDMTVRDWIKQLSEQALPGFNLGAFLTGIQRYITIASLPMFETYTRLLGAVIAGRIPNNLIGFIYKFNRDACGLLLEQAYSVLDRVL